jgi:hypothetical protein
MSMLLDDLDENEFHEGTKTPITEVSSNLVTLWDKLDSLEFSFLLKILISRSSVNEEKTG